MKGPFGRHRAEACRPAPTRRSGARPRAVRFGTTCEFLVRRRPPDQNVKRVRPPGSVPTATIAERGSTRYTFHGGGPSVGALNGAVMPAPLTSGSAGQPLSAHAF